MMVARIRVCAIILAALVLLVVLQVRAVEEAECTSAYNYLAGCLTFVAGPDPTPSPVCCGGVNHLSTTDPHCLCTIIRELDDNPNVNFTKACALAYQCSWPATVDRSECASLLVPAGYSLPPSLPPPLPGDGASAASRIVSAWQIVPLAVLIFTAFVSSILSDLIGQ